MTTGPGEYYETIGGARKEIPIDPKKFRTPKDRTNPMVKVYGLGPEGARCKSCIHCYVKEFGRRYFKCEFRGDTRGPGTDHRANWPACSKYERDPEFGKKE